MRVKYLGNSGFAIGLDRSLLLIDDISKGAFIRAESIAAFEHITVLISHAHADHFDPTIFNLYRARGGNVQYVLSGDILDTRLADTPVPFPVTRIDPGQRHEVNGISIQAYDSTDAGVSFDIYTQYAGRDVRLFHAGDLNNWHWKHDGDEEWTKKQAEDYTRILDGIAMEPKIDLAFFPFDPRMGADYEEGALQFIERFEPAMTVPMHFGATWKEPEGLTQKLEGKTLLCPLSTPGTAFEAQLA
jgi:Predicted Zn-dependent hydrolases of the beta-lactamase fold